MRCRIGRHALRHMTSRILPHREFAPPRSSILSTWSSIAHNHRMLLASGHRSCRSSLLENSSCSWQESPAAKAGLILWHFAARLEAAPFQNKLASRFFSGPLDKFTTAAFRCQPRLACMTSWSGGAVVRIPAGTSARAGIMPRMKCRSRRISRPADSRRRNLAASKFPDSPGSCRAGR